MSELLVIDPSTGTEVGRLPRSHPDRLVEVARAAHPGWARTGAGDRAGALKAGARRLRAAIDDLALLQSREGGKPLGDSRGGVEAGIGAVEQYAELGPLHRGRALQGAWDASDAMIRVPPGRRCPLPAVERPCRHRLRPDRRQPGRREHRHLQAQREDTAGHRRGHPAAERGAARGGPAVRRRRRRTGRGAVRPSRGRRGGSRRFGRHRPVGRLRLCGPGRQGRARAGWEGPDDRRRRRRPRVGRRAGRRRLLRQRRPDLHLDRTGLRPRLGGRRVRRRAGAAGPRRSGWARPPNPPPTWGR